MGATGQIGHVVVEQLLKKGHTVRAIGRDQKKLDLLKAQGAHIFQTKDFDNEKLLSEAFHEVEAVFCMLPPSMAAKDYLADQTAIGEAIVQAIKANSIRYVVNLSSLAAQLPDGTGPIKGLHSQEKRLDAIEGLNVLHLRASFFMENFFGSISIIQDTGRVKTALRPDLSIPMVCTEDIGMKAAEFLDRLDFKGQTLFEFTGPRSYTMIEATEILSKAIDKKNVQYEQLSYEEAKKMMMAQGASSKVADLMMEMYRAFNENKFTTEQELIGEHLGKITFDHFAKNTFAPFFYKSKEKVKV